MVFIKNHLFSFRNSSRSVVKSAILAKNKSCQNILGSFSVDLTTSSPFTRGDIWIKMAYDLPCMSYMAVYIISMHIIQTNSRTSTHWKLNMETGTVQTAAAADNDDDPMLSILTNKIPLAQGGWKLQAEDTCNHECQKDLDERNESISSNDGNTSSSPIPKSVSTANAPTKEWEFCFCVCAMTYLPMRRHRNDRIFNEFM